MTQHIEITKEHILEAKVKQLMRYDFLDAVNRESDKLIYQKATDIESYTKSFYDLGKSKGFDMLKVDAFNSSADTHALFNLSNYNFDLIKNLNNDLREDIRQTIWNGVANSDGLSVIADRIERLPLEPIKAGNRIISIDERARMIAVTENTRATNQGLIMSFNDYNMDLVNTNLGVNACPDCQEIHDNGPYKLEDLPEGGPPFHPNCECVLEPVETPNNNPSMPDSFLDLVSGEMIETNTEI